MNPQKQFEQFKSNIENLLMHIQSLGTYQEDECKIVYGLIPEV